MELLVQQQQQRHERARDVEAEAVGKQQQPEQVCSDGCRGSASGGGGQSSDKRVRVAVTHLDHISAEQRGTQLAHIVEIMALGHGGGRVGEGERGGEGSGSEGAELAGGSVVGQDTRVRGEEEGQDMELDVEVLVGDMNALTRSDYSDVQWEVNS